MDKKAVIEVFGSGAELARALGITRQSVCLWGDSVPLVRQYQIERLTGGRFKAPPLKPIPGIKAGRGA